MELKCNNSNGEIVLTIKVISIELFVVKKYQNLAQNQISYVFFSKKCYDYLQNKMVHNFHITNPNGMNQSFPYRQNTIYEKKIQIFISNFCGFNFLCL